jgi:hypothetical protein
MRNSIVIFIRLQGSAIWQEFLRSRPGAVLITIAEETGGSGEFAFFWRSFSRLDAGTIAHGRSKSSERVLGRFGQAISTRSPLHARSGAEMARKAWTEQRSRGLRPEAGNLE